MKRIFNAAIFGVAVLQINAGGGGAGDVPSSATNAPASEAHQLSGVRFITLPHFEPDLPVAPGRDEYMVVCISCHSPRSVSYTHLTLPTNREV